MAKDNNLQDFLTDIADAIREKKGTTEKINPQDFATEIANLSSGGGSGSGSGDGSNIEYLDLREYDVMNDDSKWSIFRLYSISCIVIMNNDYKAYMPSGILAQVMSAPNSNFNVLACAIDFSVKTSVFLGELQTINEYFIQKLGDMSFTQEELNAIPRITKEQFYSLEA